MASVYILHFDQPYKHAAHYVGWASQLQRRLANHAAGQGARLTQVVREAGIGWTVGRVWRGPRASRRFERSLKKREWGPLTALCAGCTSNPTRRLERRAR